MGLGCQPAPQLDEDARDHRIGLLVKVERQLEDLLVQPVDTELPGGLGGEPGEDLLSKSRVGVAAGDPVVGALGGERSE